MFCESRSQWDTCGAAKRASTIWRPMKDISVTFWSAEEFADAKTRSCNLPPKNVCCCGPDPSKVYEFKFGNRMIKKEVFEALKAKYGEHASWAFWNLSSGRPKSNMGVGDLFDLGKNRNLLNELSTSCVMVGLNFSRPAKGWAPFQNFHDENKSANDFKIRYAFSGTKFYGAYMTDVIKNHVEVDSGKVMVNLRKNSGEIIKHVTGLCEELDELKNERAPIVLAFGKDVFEILSKNLPERYYSHLIQITHYSHRISKENYKQQVHSQIAACLGDSEF